MRSHFFITGLPRTRTAWLANFFTGPHSFCLHDGLADCRAVTDLRERFQTVLWDYPVIEHPHVATGNADSSLVLVAEQVVEAFPGSRWLHITRDWREALESYHRAFGKRPPYAGMPDAVPSDLTDTFEHLARENADLPRLVPEPEYFSLAFHDLHRRDAMLEAWQWLLPGRPFPEHRWRMLSALNVQLQPGARAVDMDRLREMFGRTEEEPVCH